MPYTPPPDFPTGTDPNAHSECPECWSLVRVKRASAHWGRHRDDDKWREGVDRGLEHREPHSVQVVDWPEPPAETTPLPAGPYAPEPGL